MSKMKKLIWLLPVLLAMLVSSCLKDDVNETVILLGTESDVKPIGEVIPDTLLNFLADPTVMDGFTLPVGNMPPDIQGEYVFFPRELFADNGFSPVANDTLFFRFGGTPESQYYPNGQHNRLVPCDIHEKGFSLKSIEKAFVMGSGDEFTVYFAVQYDDCVEVVSGTQYTLTRGYIITGTVTATGIDRAIVACVNMDAKFNVMPSGVPEEALERLIGQIFVYRVKTDDPNNPFGSAIRQQWYK